MCGLPAPLIPHSHLRPCQTGCRVDLAAVGVSSSPLLYIPTPTDLIPSCQVCPGRDPQLCQCQPSLVKFLALCPRAMHLLTFGCGRHPPPLVPLRRAHPPSFDPTTSPCPCAIHVFTRFRSLHPLFHCAHVPTVPTVPLCQQCLLSHLCQQCQLCQLCQLSHLCQQCQLCHLCQQCQLCPCANCAHTARTASKGPLTGWLFGRPWRTRKTR